MTVLNWTNVLEFNPDSLSEQLKDELGNELIWCEVENEDELTKVKHMLKIAQQILKYKNEQVETLTAEIDNLAIHQGEYEAQNQQSLQDEIEKLQAQLSQASRFQNLSKDDGVFLLQQEVAKLEAQNEQLLLELQDKEKDYLNAEKETKKYLEQITALQKEKNELLRELSTLQKELNDYSDSKSRLSTPLSPTNKQQDLTDTVRQKNKQITELLEDIQTIENENGILKENLSSVRDELNVATKSVSELTNQIQNLKLAYEETNEKLSLKNQEILGLKSQISELVSEKLVHENQLDGLITALDSRVKQWQVLLDEKDSELKALKSQLVNYGENNTQIVSFTQVLRKREEQIEELQKQLKQATYDLEESANLLLKCKLQDNAPQAPQNLEQELKVKLQLAEEANQLLLQRVELAEQEAHAKAEQVSELIISLREKESGTSAETIIKELQKQKTIRDHHIERLIQAGNSLQEETERLECENIALREKFGVSKDEIVSIENVKSRHIREKLKLVQLEQDLEKAQSTINTLKIENRKLMKKVSLKALNQVSFKSDSLTSVSSDNDENVEKSRAKPKIESEKSKKISEETSQSDISHTLLLKLTEVINENESLRTGLHEILDSIQKNNGASVKVESRCLEQLLEALDARHVSGWYHPAMRLQAQLHNLQGYNSSLREQLYQAKVKETQLLEKLQHCNAFMGQMENYVSTLQYSASIPEQELTTPKKEVEPPSDPTISYPEESSVQVNLEPDVNINKLEKLQEKLDFAESKLYDERNRIENLEQSMKLEVEELKRSKAEIEVQFNEMKSSWESMQKSPNSLQQQLADLTLRLTSLAGDCEKHNRMCKALKNSENLLIQQKNKVEEELVQLKHQLGKEIKLSNSEKRELLIDKAKLEQLVENSVAISAYEELKHQNFDLSIKYKALLNKQLTVINANDSVAKFETEIHQLTAQMETKFEEFIKSIEKSSHVVSNTTPEQVSEINQQLTSVAAKLLIETQRSEYFTKINQSMKDQLAETESRCKSLQSSLVELENSCYKSELSEAVLRDKLFSYIDLNSHNQLQTKYLDLEKQVVFLESERQRLIAECDLVRMSTSKFIVEHNIMQLQFDSLKRQVLELQSSSDEKLIIGQLMKEIEFMKEKSLKGEFEVEELKLKVQELESLCHQQKIKISEGISVNSTIKNNYHHKQRLFQEIIANLIEHWTDHIPQPSIECWVEKICRLKEEKDFAWQQLKLQLTANTNKAVELLENHPSLKSNKLKLQNISMQLSIEKLEKKLELTESRLQKQEELSNRLEEELVTLDKEWESKLKKWTCSLVEISDSDVDSKQTSVVNTVSTNKETDKHFRTKLNQANSTIQQQSQKLVQLETEIEYLKKKLASSQKHVGEKEKLISMKENTIHKLETEISEMSEILRKTETNSVEILALKTTVDSLQNIVNQKEESMRRYQTLLTESREERSQAEAVLQREMQNLQEKLNSQNVVNNRMKKPYDIGEIPPVQGYITKVHELEDELAQVNNQVEKLSSQLSVAQQLANQWNNVAADANQINRESDSKPDSAREDKENLLPNSKFYKEKLEEVEKLTEELDLVKHELAEKKKAEEKLKESNEDFKQQISSKDQQLNFSKAEISRLKHQLNIRTHSVNSVREEQLKKKVKLLEEQLDKFLKQENEENRLRRERCSKEVEKWQAGKKWQATNEKLRLQLKDSLSQLEASRSTVDKLKDILAKVERDKMILEMKLKNSQVKVNKSAMTQSLIEELQREKKRLEDELTLLRKTCNVSSDATSLVSVIEAQDKKIKTLETYLTSEKSQTVVEEMEKLFEKQSNLLKINSNLEEKNLELKLQLEELQLREDARGQEIYKVTQMSCQQHNQSQIRKLETELKIMRENYLNAMRQVSDLKSEIKVLELQQNRKSDSDEIKQLRAQLSHKNALLSQVKLSLGRAVAKGIHP